MLTKELQQTTSEIDQKFRTPSVETAKLKGVCYYLCTYLYILEFIN